MNNKCYFCGGSGILSSDETCACVSGKCQCYNCLELRHHNNTTEPLVRKKPKQWEQPELPFNTHKQGATGYDPSYPDKNYAKKKPTKPDPATVEAELQLEEQLWQS